MRRLFLTGILTTVLAALAYAQTAPAQGQASPPAPRHRAAVAGQAASAKTAPGTILGSVRLPKKVMANGQPLDPGTYQVRITDETAKPVAGQTADSERWVEFLRGGQVKGRELATVVPDSEIAQVANGPGKPPRGGHRVDLLKTQKYWRVWINKGGSNYLVHLPPA
jgi:hypothetical protein